MPTEKAERKKNTPRKNPERIFKRIGAFAPPHWATYFSAIWTKIITKRATVSMMPSVVR